MTTQTTDKKVTNSPLGIDVLNELMKKQILIIFGLSLAVLLMAFSGCTKKSTTALKVSLNNEWKISLEPGGNFWGKDVLPHNLGDITVPGGAQIQSFNIEYDKPFVYKKQITIPSNFKDMEIFLQFDMSLNT